jgi:2-isopropylmalate synthase
MDEDLEALVTEGILRSAEVFSLEYLHVTCGTTVLPMASVELSINGRPVQGANYGNGPIDSAFNTIAKLTGTQSELLRFTVSALTGGTDAQGEVTVRLRENGLVALGKGRRSGYHHRQRQGLHQRAEPAGVPQGQSGQGGAAMPLTKL